MIYIDNYFKIGNHDFDRGNLYGIPMNTYGAASISVVSKISVWLMGDGLRILLIVVIGLIAYYLGRAVIMRSIAAVSGKSRKRKDFYKRIQTLGHLAVAAWKVVVLAAVAITILPLLGINIAPILAGAGIIGVAVGLGSQTMIKDFISGIFMVVEDQYSKGDRVKINTVEGVIEDMSLRAVILRDDNGVLYYIPNSSVSMIANYSKAWRYVSLPFSVTPDKDEEVARQQALAVATETIDASKYKEHYLSKPKIKITGASAQSADFILSVKVGTGYYQRTYSELAAAFYRRLGEN